MMVILKSQPILKTNFMLANMQKMLDIVKSFPGKIQTNLIKPHKTTQNLYLHCLVCRHKSIE